MQMLKFSVELPVQFLFKGVNPIASLLYREMLVDFDIKADAFFLLSKVCGNIVGVKVVIQADDMNPFCDGFAGESNGWC